jgi:activator of 2-hydroxyglutaryl-CoA dehydratase
MAIEFSKGPSLVEPSMKYFTGELLKKCKQTRHTYYNLIFNVAIGTCFFIGIGIILISGRKSKVYKLENQEKLNREKQEYILQTCKKMNDLEEKKHHEMISNLPFESELHKYDKMFL